MCLPAPALAALSIATTATRIYAQNESAEAQQDLISAQADAERRESLEAAEEDLGMRIKAARELRSRMRVAAGESGAQGASFAAAINQTIQDQDSASAAVANQLSFTQRGVNDRQASALSQVRTVSGLEAGLQIATAGARGLAVGRRPEDAKAGRTSDR